MGVAFIILLINVRHYAKDLSYIVWFRLPSNLQRCMLLLPSFTEEDAETVKLSNFPRLTQLISDGIKMQMGILTLDTTLCLIPMLTLLLTCHCRAQKLQQSLFLYCTRYKFLSLGFKTFCNLAFAVWPNLFLSLS